jgi:hypothetical protein
VAGRLQDENSTRVRYETLGAVVIAGAAAVATGGAVLAGLPILEAAMAIGGGTMASGLGTLALFVETHQEYRHPRNLLRNLGRAFHQPVISFLCVEISDAPDEGQVGGPDVPSRTD